MNQLLSLMILVSISTTALAQSIFDSSTSLASIGQLPDINQIPAVIQLPDLSRSPASQLPSGNFPAVDQLNDTLENCIQPQEDEFKIVINDMQACLEQFSSVGTMDDIQACENQKYQQLEVIKQNLNDCFEGQ